MEPFYVNTLRNGNSTDICAYLESRDIHLSKSHLKWDRDKIEKLLDLMSQELSIIIIPCINMGTSKVVYVTLELSMMEGSDDIPIIEVKFSNTIKI